MNKIQLESILRQIEEYRKSLDPLSRDEIELIDLIIEQYKENLLSWVDGNISLEGLFEEIVEQQSEIDSSFIHDSNPLIIRLINHIKFEQ
ncbi:MAG: hypothetical protein MSS84_02445 [Bacteroidales bacterium]|nr:hypothetical protein [Bacteroidales bacterium]